MQPNGDTIDTCDHLGGTNVKTLMDHLIEERGEHWKFGHLPEMRSNSTYHLGALNSEFFSE